MPPESTAPAAPAPAAPSPAPSSPAPAAPNPGSGDGGSSSAEDAFERQFDLGEGSTSAAPAAAPSAPAAPAAKPPASSPKPAAKPPQAPAKPAAAAPTEFDEEDGVQVPRFKSDKDFRGWGLGGYKKAKQLETDLESLRTKHAELEQRIPRTEAERQQLATKLADLEKKHNEVLAELNFSNYERSPEYKEKYEKPYQEAYSRALRRVSQLTVTEEDRTKPADPETGKYPTRERKATQQDFDEIYSLDFGPATKLAIKKFGPEFMPSIMDHWEKIREKAELAVNALNDWKQNSEKRQKEQEAQGIQTRERITSLWTQVHADIKSKNKDLFTERPDDKEWNDALTKGTQMADTYFNDRDKLPIEQRVVFDANVHNRIAAFPALVSRMRKLETENAQLAKDLAAMRGSSPGAPISTSPNPPATESEGAMAEFDKRL